MALVPRPVAVDQAPSALLTPPKAVDPNAVALLASPHTDYNCPEATLELAPHAVDRAPIALAPFPQDILSTPMLSRSQFTSNTCLLYTSDAADE